MSLVLVTPGTPAITLAQAKAHLRVDHADEDALISALVAAATAHAELWTSKTFEPSTWDFVIDRFPRCEIGIPKTPVQEIVSISYVDAAGMDQVVAPTDYAVDLASESAWIVPAHGFGWPGVMNTVNAVRVRFVAGRGTPDDVRAAILLIVGYLYANRGEVVSATMELPLGAHVILNLHRRLSV